MKINNKGYASTIIMFSILTLFLVSMLMLVKTMNNSSTLNKKITEKVVDNINYDASGTVQDQIAELNTTITSMQNQIDNIKGEVINEIYPVGSIYMSTEDDTIEKVQNKFGGTWEKYAQGRTLIGEGAGTDSNGLVQIFSNGSTGGEYTHKLTISELPKHNHSYSYSIADNVTGSTILNESNLPPRTLFELKAKSSATNAGVSWGAVNVEPGSWYISSNYDFYYAGVLSSIGGQGHNHSITSSNKSSSTEISGSDVSFNMLNPYVVTYMYRKISN